MSSKNNKLDSKMLNSDLSAPSQKRKSEKKRKRDDGSTAESERKVKKSKTKSAVQSLNPDSVANDPADTVVSSRKGKSDKAAKDSRKKKKKTSKAIDNKVNEAKDQTSDKIITKTSNGIEPLAPNRSTDKLSKSSKKKKTTKKVAADENNSHSRDKPDTHGESDQAERKVRFVCFVGNLPFTAEEKHISAHFANVQPSSIRLIRKKHSNESKGFAFVEFDRYDHMKTSLQLYHHSSFTDGLSPPRRINVELTAGGGGNSETRKEKLKQKNSKLNQERERKYKEQKEEKAGEDGERASTGMHPSRMARMKALGSLK